MNMLLQFMGLMIVLAILSSIYTYFYDRYKKEKPPIKFLDKVKINSGFYAGCIGIVNEEKYKYCGFLEGYRTIYIVEITGLRTGILIEIRKEELEKI